MKVLAVALLVLASGLAGAQTVSMSGSLGDKALLIIDGSPRTVASGETVKGVKLIRVGGGEATVEVAGKRIVLAIGGAQVNLGRTGSDAGGSTISLTAGTGGHFITTGAINGKSVSLVVDTGATFVAMGPDDAQRLGVDIAGARRGLSNTANGQIVTYRVKLASVQIGDVMVYDVDAVVGPQPMLHILLGNSYLTRFQMKRENDTLTLIKRY